MVTLLESESEQDLKLILNRGIGDELIIIDEGGNSETFDIITYREKYYQIITMVYPIKEGKTYTIIVKFEGVQVYKGKLFCTNQTDYSINKDTYNEKTSDNTYIIID